MQNQRFVFTLTDLENPEVSLTFGVYAKKWNQAKSKVYNYAVENGLEVSDDSRLDGKPSNKPADYEIPQEEEVSVHNESY